MECYPIESSSTRDCSDNNCCGVDLPSLFPHNITLEEARRVVTETTAHNFRECVKDDYIIFNYDFAFLGVFPDPSKACTLEEARQLQIRRECRGLIFSKKTEKVISRRLHKFFNLNEMPETEPDKIDWARPYIILNKIDGSLVAPFITQGRLRFGTKGGVTEVSTQMEEHFLNETKVPYYSFCKDWVDRGYTPLFEWCSPKKTIIIGYEKDMLILLAIRNNETGEYVPFKDMVESAEASGIPVVTPALNLEEKGEEVKDGHDLLKITKASDNIEGYVIRFDNGEMYKVKSDWYIKKSKTMAKIKVIGEKDLWKLILDNDLDDVVSAYDTRRRKMIQEFQAELIKKLAETADKISEYISKVKESGIERREFATQIAELYNNYNCENEIKEKEKRKEEKEEEKRDNLDSVITCMFDPHIPRAMYFAAWSGKDVHNALKTYIRKNCENTTKFELARKVLHEIKYKGEL